MYGWIFVSLGVLTAIAPALSTWNGYPRGWQEYLACLGLGLVLAVIGVALMSDRAWVGTAALLACAVFMLVVGAFGVLLPEAVLTSSIRGPRTVGTARVIGALLLLAGTLLTVSTVGSAVTRLRRRGNVPRGE